MSPQQRAPTPHTPTSTDFSQPPPFDNENPEGTNGIGKQAKKYSRQTKTCTVDIYTVLSSRYLTPPRQVARGNEP